MMATLLGLQYYKPVLELLELLAVLMLQMKKAIGHAQISSEQVAQKQQ
jgi:hypothetical protein